MYCSHSCLSVLLSVTVCNTTEEPVAVCATNLLDRTLVTIKLYNLVVVAFLKNA